MRFFNFINARVGLLLACVFAFLFAHAAMAADAVVAAPAGFEWIGMVLQFLQGLPKVGPALSAIFAVVALVAVVMTALSTALQAVLKAPEIMARFAGASDLADKIKAFADKVLPWLQYLSIYNVQKKQ